MSRVGWNTQARAPWRMPMIVIAALVLLASCNKTEKPASEQVVQKTFASPEEAGAALVAAAKSGDPSVLLAISARAAMGFYLQETP